jgi:hypothetical protein
MRNPTSGTSESRPNLLAYIDSLKEFKVKVTAFKVEIMDQIEKTFDTKA